MAPAERFHGRRVAELFVAKRDRFLAARQGLNALDAIDQARDDGFDWLLHVDAEELVCLDKMSMARGQLE